MNSAYYAVIFSSQRNQANQDDYDQMAAQMVELAKQQKGFKGMESVRGADGFGVTISYWESEADIKAWKANAEHLEAQHLGRCQWYESFSTKVCRVEREYSFKKS